MARSCLSIIVPTKNRSALAVSAVRSVLRQTFRDFEIVLVDNDDSDKTQLALSEFDDSRIRYIRTGDLSMHDNWEAGFAAASGEWITVLSDRSAYSSRYSLERIIEHLPSIHRTVMSWRWIPISPDYHAFTPQCSGQLQEFSPGHFLSAFAAGDWGELMKRGPIPLGACVHHSVIDRVRKLFSGKVCLPVSPDYNLAFSILSCVDRLFHLDEALVLSGGMDVSNGVSLSTKSGGAESFLRSIPGGVENAYRHVPVKAFTIFNSVVNDYLEITGQIGLPLSRYPMQPVGYFMLVLRDLETTWNAGGNITLEYSAWMDALAKEPGDVQSQVRDQIEDERIFRGFMPRLLRQGRRLRMNRLWKRVKHTLTKPTRFSSLVDYVESTERGE